MKQIVSYKIIIVNSLAIKRIILLAGIVLFFSMDGFASLRANFIVSSKEICDGSSVTFTSTSTGTSGTTKYYWDFGEGASPASATGRGPHIVSYTGTGVSMVRLTLTDEAKDEDADSSENFIIRNAIPDAPKISVINNCDGTSSISTMADGALLWSTAETTSSIIVSIPDIYTVTTTIDGCTSLPGSGTAAPKIAPATPVVVVVDNCDGTSTLSTDAEGELLWSTTETSSSIIVSVADIYTVTTTIDSCSSLPGSGTAAPKTIPASPVVTVVDNCNGTSTLSTDAAGALLWSTADTTSSITVTIADVYTVTTSIDGCTSLSGSGTAAPKTVVVTPIVIVVNNCDGTSTLSTDAEGALLWSTAETTSSITVSEADIYTVTTTIDGCTSLPGSGSAAPNTTPAIPAVTVVNNCNGTSTLSTVASGALLWSTAETTSSITVPLAGIYTVSTSIDGCPSLPGSGTAAPETTPSAPVVAAVLQPTCTVSTGAVELNGLPSGTWTINPGSITGSTTSKTIAGLASGTHSFTVTNSSGCTSSLSSAVIIITQPLIPAPPTAGTIIQPSCTQPTGSLQLTGLPESGIWTLTRYPGTVILNGTGKSTTISDLPTGTYNFTLANTAGCVSSPSANVVIDAQPPSPPAPVQTTDCSLGFNKAVVKVISPIGAGLEYSIDGGKYTSSTTFTDQKNGTHVITVKNISGCITSGADFSVSCGCPDPPVITLSSISGMTCGTAFLVSNNLFSGSATKVTITTNGKGTISPVSANVSPFSFTYTPSQSDSGKEIIISLITNNPLGSPCAAGTGTFTLKVNTKPSAPVVGVVTQMTCIEPTGSVKLSGLPSVGTWILTGNQGALSITGTGTSTEIIGLAAGVHSFSVTNQEGCTSTASSNVVIDSNPGSPASPTIGTIISPTCNEPTGSVSLNGLPLTGSWTLTRSPDNFISTGSGASITITDLSSGTYNYTVTNSIGCISELSKNIVIPVQPYSVTLVITNPQSICIPGKADLTNPSVTAGSTQGITYAYYTDASATISFATPSLADNGIYYIKGTSSGGCYDIKPVKVTVIQAPVAYAGPDKILDNQFETIMEAEITQINDTGSWSVISGTGEFLDESDARTQVNGLSINENIFLWMVSNGICPASSDTVIITVRGLEIQTLITPNMDGRNDYFEVKGLESMGRTELVIFDRRGVQVYKNGDYDNLWNGVDYNGNPLHDDTYFYSLRTGNGNTVNGFVVILR